jgi:GNAT acetyltransferase-like protein
MLFVSRNISGSPLSISKPPVYMQRWFTEIAERNRHTKTTMVFEDGALAGSLTIILRRNFLGMKQAYNLPWARVCGPNIPEDFSQTRKAQITRQLIRQLPTNVSYFLTLATEFDYRLFLSEGFQPDLEDNYTVAPDLSPVLPTSFSKMTRRHIRQAQEHLDVSTTTAEAFVETYAADLIRRRRKPYAPLAIAQKILEEALRRGQARIFTATQRDTGEIDAAVACLWDDTNYYYWMTTRRVQADGESKPHQGAVKLLLWSAIQDAAAKGLTFDFDGVPSNFSSKKDGVTRLYDGMGAQRSIRYRVKRETKVEQFAERLRAPTKRVLAKTVGTFLTLKMNY